MKILQLGDTHLGIQRRTWGGPPGWSCAADHQAALRRALQPAMEGEVELVIHTGDLFDRSRPPPEACRAAAAELRELGRRVPVVVLAGNHDRHGIQRHFGGGIPGVQLVDRATLLQVAGLRIGLVPHHRQAEDWARAAAPVAAAGIDLLVTHQAVQGCWVPGFRFQPGSPPETLSPRHIPAGVRWVLSGHLHPHQALRCGAATVVYAGSTARTSAAEGPQEKGSVIWELGARPQWQFRPHATRPWVTVSQESELEALPTGCLARLPPQQIRAWSPAVIARGGRVLLPSRQRAARAQLRLF